MIQETLYKPSIEEDEMLTFKGKPPSWKDPIYLFLLENKLLGDQEEARRIAKQAAMYTIHNNKLYRRGLSNPLLKCLDEQEAEYVLAEIHEGVCGIHDGSRPLATKVLRAGFYWPTLRSDCLKWVKKCERCQKFAQIPHAPPEWGIDILGPFPQAKGQVKFLIVAIDYFSKWIEAEPLARITAGQVKKFIWKNIICRHDIPHSITTDNSTQFVDQSIHNFCKELGITQTFSFVEHPQTNGQAKAANKVILNGLRKRLGNAKGLWTEELPSVLWAYHVTPQSSTKETPFRLTYGTDAMIPVEVGEPSLRRETFDKEHNEAELVVELDTAEEIREMARIRNVAAKQAAERKHNTRVKPRDFRQGDLVLRLATGPRKDRSEGKLAPTWEGPFKIIETVGKGAYRIKTIEGKALPRTWNATHLKYFYT